MGEKQPHPVDLTYLAKLLDLLRQKNVLLIKTPALELHVMPETATGGTSLMKHKIEDVPTDDDPYFNPQAFGGVVPSFGEEKTVSGRR